MKKFIIPVAVVAAVGWVVAFGALSEVKLTASDAEWGDYFGYSVAVSGDIAVVGAYGEDAGGSAAGAAYVFQRDAGGDNWGEVAKLVASDAEAGDYFGYSVAVSGEIAIVGAYGEDAGGSAAGTAYVFQRDVGGADNWGEVAKLVASDAEAGDYFGYSVAVSGDVAIVGGYGEDEWGSAAGAAYVFQRDWGGANNWGEKKKLPASDAGAGDSFGYSVAVAGDIAIVGAYGEDAGGSDAGAAYVFQRDNGGTDSWGEVKKLVASDPQAADYFGVSVAVGGDNAVVGATYEDERGSAAGAAYVFQRDVGGSDKWGQVKKLMADDAEAGDHFGSGVAVGGDIMVGAAGEDAKGSDAGAAYVFGEDMGGTDNWGQVEKLMASDAQAGDFFGASVSLVEGGGTAFAGAYFEDARGSDAGAAYAFRSLPSVGGIQALPDRARPEGAATPAGGPWPTTYAAIAGAGVAVALAIVLGGWCARRRLLR
jgi:hypothetical protein